MTDTLSTPTKALQGRLKRLRDATQSSDLGALLSLYNESCEAPWTPLSLLRDIDAHGQRLVQSWFEAWDKAVQTLPTLAERVLAHDNGTVPLANLLLNPVWLRRCESRRPDSPVPLPANYSSLSPREQRIALARTLVRQDGQCPFDYEETVKHSPENTIPALTLWFLGTYLLSPLLSLDPRILAQRRAAIDAFISHQNSYAGVASQTILTGGGAAFNMTSVANDLPAFVTALCDRVLSPALNTHVRSKSSSQHATSSDGDGVGVVASFWNESCAVYRCLAPMLEPARLAGAQTLAFDSGVCTALKDIPESWRPAAAIQAHGLEGLGAATDVIRKKKLDLLFFPEVGLTLTSRWLATQRLARVQATGYGHPATTGSREIDYFIGGQAIEKDTPASTYRERLVLVPGLGVVSTPPLAPSRPRQRPEDPDRLILTALTSYNKWTPTLLKTWSAALRQLGRHARFELVPGLPNSRVQMAVQGLSRFMSAGNLNLTPNASQQTCVNLLTESDIYLDSFPFGGYNTLVEALASGCPVVTLEGRYAFGRCGAAMLRLLELPDFLIASTPAEYVAAVHRLASDRGLRQSIRAMLNRERVVEILCNESTQVHFQAALEWIREQGPNNPGRPVLIRAGEEAVIL